MRKRMLCLLFCLLLTGCRRQTPQLAVQWQQTEIALDAPAAPILEALGPPFGYAEHLRRGIVEKTYRFSGLQIETYPGRGGERILRLLLTSPDACTPEGIAMGDTARQVQDCYGADAIVDGRCTIRREKETLTLLLQNNRVSQIDYSLRK